MLLITVVDLSRYFLSQHRSITHREGDTRALVGPSSSFDNVKMPKPQVTIGCGARRSHTLKRNIQNTPPHPSPSTKQNPLLPHPIPNHRFPLPFSSHTPPITTPLNPDHHPLYIPHQHLFSPLRFHFIPFKNLLSTLSSPSPFQTKTHSPVASQSPFPFTQLWHSSPNITILGAGSKLSHINRVFRGAALLGVWISGRGKGQECEW